MLSSRGALEDEVQQRIFVRDALWEIARLPARQHDAFVETSTRGRGRAEVASSMALSEGAVRQLVHRSRATLRTAARAILHFPFARWAAGATYGSGVDQLSETTIGAGTAGWFGGAALKLGALVASSALATGLVSSRLGQHRPVARQGHMRLRPSPPGAAR
ncbi:MAG: sigma factor-like helix-turn-helix DNA-binding protein [Solirubrobacteraceae bacterium]